MSEHAYRQYAIDVEPGVTLADLLRPEMWRLNTSGQLRPRDRVRVIAKDDAFDCLLVVKAGRLRDAEQRVTTAQAKADAAEQAASARIAAAEAKAGKAKAEADAAIDVARNRTRDEVVGAEQAAVEAIAQIDARRQRAETDAVATEQRLNELRGQVGAAQQQLDAIRARIETLRTSFAA